MEMFNSARRLKMSPSLLLLILFFFFSPLTHSIEVTVEEDPTVDVGDKVTLECAVEDLDDG
jgi:hypothetical protein